MVINNMNYKYTISIKNNTNKIIGSSEDKFSGINIGNLIKLENDPKLYEVSNRESFLYIKDFVSNDSKIIEINDDLEMNLQKNDTIKITFKEYEAKFIVNIINKGKGYTIGNKINTKGGILSFDVSIGTGQPTTLEVVESNNEGGVEKLNIIEHGKYITYPASPIETYGNRGEGLVLDIKYLELSNRSFLERIIMDIYLKEGKTYIVLDYSLPLNLTYGKLSVNKTAVLLSSNYMGETQRNINYETFTHFTPNIRLPMLLKNSMSQEVIFNKACLILDEEIGKIKRQLGIK